GTRNVEALELNCFKERLSPYHFTAEEFKELRNLRYLRVDYADLDGDFMGIFFNLRWLQWRYCPRQFSAFNIDLKNLVILDLSCNNLKDDWEGWSQIKMAKRLKVLNLSGCSGLTRTPDFSTLPALEILNLGQREKLIEIHPSIWKLKNLRVLDISRSRHSRSRHSRSRHSYYDRRPITKFPDEIGNLEKLEEIYATYCCDLHGEIPSSIGRLSSLRILKLDSTNIYSLPTSICGLSRLETLDLLCCYKLQSLPDELPSSLTSLRVTCQSMKTFPSRLSNLINLKNLVFYYCVNLVEITRDIGKLSQLETLTLHSCNKLRTLPAEIGAISQLKELQLHSCSNLQCILALPPSLFIIRVKDCQSLERLPDLSNLKNLSYLTLRHLDKLREIPELRELEYLYIAGCISLKRLPDLSNLKKLQGIYIEKCKKLIEIQDFGKLELLTELNISGCESLERLPDVSNLGMLKYLTLYGCQKLVEIEGLGSLKSLEILDVSCTSLERLDLSSLNNLKILTILHCKNLTEIQGIEELRSMAGCKLIEKLPDLSNLKKL
ncbi:putative adenylate cyclase regulatory protein, partial [Fagus crenata]